MNALEWAGVSGPVWGVIGAWGKGFYDRNIRRASGNKIDAEAAEIIASTAVKLVAPLTAQIEVLTRRVDAYADYIRELHIWISSITHEVPPAPPALLDI